MIRFSFRNLAATNHLTPSSVDPAWPAANARWPERPFQPWRTATDGTQSLVLGFDPVDVMPLDVVAPLHANFTSATVQGNATNVWGAPTYSQAITLGRSLSGRYHHGHRPVSAFSYAYLRLLIPSQTPVAEGLTNYAINGGMEEWSGGLPTGWGIISGTAGSFTMATTAPGTVKIGRAAVQVTRTGTDAVLGREVHLDYPPLSRWSTLKLTVSAWVRAPAANTAYVALWDGIAYNEQRHSGSNQFERLTATITVGSGGAPTFLRVQFGGILTNVTTYFDDVRLTVAGYALGGLWAGQFTSPPLDILYEPEEARPTHYEDVTASHGGWAQRLTLARPTVRVTCRRLAETEAHLAAWREIDRQWDAADSALVCLRDAYPAETYVMRRTDVSRWVHSHIWSESEMELTEVVR